MAGISMLIRTYPKIFICIYLYAPPLAIGVIWDYWNQKKILFTASGNIPSHTASECPVV